MSTALFLKIDGITGESQDSNHKGWIAIDSLYGEPVRGI
ncbi:type VI secretion system secreted protein Hcp [Erwinia toletana]|uniref:Type VI secretion system secreted protein Hcp n=1 Tax=Winslowiella toletana TaxID=92490 RepID=A0ABS4PC55_9GAMM|nr:type VI secretion system secreted protein Hcp [Winslowiella toletana]